MVQKRRKYPKVGVVVREDQHERLKAEPNKSLVVQRALDLYYGGKEPSDNENVMELLELAFKAIYDIYFDVSLTSDLIEGEVCENALNILEKVFEVDESFGKRVIEDNNLINSFEGSLFDFNLSDENLGPKMAEQRWKWISLLRIHHPRYLERHFPWLLRS